MTLLCGTSVYFGRMHTQTQIHRGSMSHILVLLNIVLNWKQCTRRSSYLTCNLCDSWNPLSASCRTRAGDEFTGSFHAICIRIMTIPPCSILSILIAVKSGSAIVRRTSISYWCLICFPEHRQKWHFAAVFSIGHCGLGSLARRLLLPWRFRKKLLPPRGNPWCLLIRSWFFRNQILIHVGKNRCLRLFFLLEGIFSINLYVDWELGRLGVVLIVARLSLNVVNWSSHAAAEVPVCLVDYSAGSGLLGGDNRSLKVML